MWQLGYLGLRRETTYGKAVTPTAFLPYRRTEFSQDAQGPDFSGSGAEGYIPLNQAFRVGFTGNADAQPDCFGHFLTGLLGQPRTSKVSSGVYSHQFEFRRDRPSYTIETGNDDLGNRAIGAVVENMTVGVKAASRMYFLFEGSARDTKPTSWTAPTFASEEAPQWSDVTLVVSGTPDQSFMDAAISIAAPVIQVDGFSQTGLPAGCFPSAPPRIGVALSVNKPSQLWFNLLRQNTRVSLTFQATGSLVGASSYQIILQCPQVQFRTAPFQSVVQTQPVLALQGLAYPAPGAVSGIRITLVNVTSGY